MNLVTRGQWGAAKERGATRFDNGKPIGVAVHYSGSDSDRGDNHGRCAGRVRNIQSFHQDTRGWFDIAYNFVVCKHGHVFEGRGWDKRSAAQGSNSGNRDYLAVCFLGADIRGRDDVEPAGREALADVIRRARVDDVKPHSHFHPTECPGDELRAFIALNGWREQKPVWPRPLPRWFWKWAAWHLGEGDFKQYGRRKGPRPVPRRLVAANPWVWARMRALLRARKPSG